MFFSIFSFQPGRFTRTIMKKLLYYLTRLSQVLLSNKYPRTDSNQIVFFPVFGDKESISDQYHRIQWYIPSSAGAKIYLPVADELREINLDALPSPEYLRQSLDHQQNVILCSKEDAIEKYKTAKVICVWRTENNQWLKVLWRHLLKVRIVDPDYYKFSETHSYPAIYWYDLLEEDKKREWISDSYRVFEKMSDTYHDSGISFVFGTGPSSTEIYEYSYDKGVKIICNSIVRNDGLLEHIHPSVLVFIDSVFHFGASKYAGEFFTDVKKVFRKYRPFIVTNQVGYALIRAHFPESKHFLMAIPSKRLGEPVIPSRDTFITRDYPNVLTRYMLPLASALSTKIVLVGFDGRDPNEDYFWKHNPQTQYVTNMSAARLAHPAFFKDINYDDYYQKHCEVLSTMISKFESQGKEIVTWTRSYIPALREKFVKPE